MTYIFVIFDCASCAYAKSSFCISTDGCVCVCVCLCQGLESSLADLNCVSICVHKGHKQVQFLCDLLISLI